MCTFLNLPADFAKLRKCKVTQLLNSSLRKSYLKLWEKNLKTVMEVKLRTYCKIKTSFGSEKYLHTIYILSILKETYLMKKYQIYLKMQVKKMLTTK